MIQPHELFPGAWMLDKDGQPMRVFSIHPGYAPGNGGLDVLINNTHWLSECRPIELIKVAFLINTSQSTPEHLLLIPSDAIKAKWIVMDMLDDREEFSATHLHNLQAFFNRHYSPITINEQQLREALK